LGLRPNRSIAVKECWSEGFIGMKERVFHLLLSSTPELQHSNIVIPVENFKSALKFKGFQNFLGR
jgi:hypothetical protein